MRRAATVLFVVAILVSLFFFFFRTSEDVVFLSHKDPTFHPSGDILATAARARKNTFDPREVIVLWDISNSQNPKQLARLIGHNSYIKSIAFHPDGNTLASSSQDGSIILWDISNPRNPTQLARLTEVSVWTESVAFHPDGDLLAIAGLLGDAPFALWDVSNPQTPTRLVRWSDVEPEDWGRNVVFHPDGDILASDSYLTNGDRVTTLWNVSNPQNPTRLVRLTDDNASVFNVAFHPDGDILASVLSDYTIIVWDISNPQNPLRLARLTGHSDFVYSIAFHPDGDILASGSRSGNGTVILWNLADPRNPTQLTPPLTAPLTDYDGMGHADFSEAVYSVAFHPDGDILAIEDNNVILRNLRNR